jgi:hypothetical protein
MANQSKPRPENRREMMDNLVEPYDQTIGNPNDVYSKTVRPGQPEFNRAYEVSEKKDTDINVSVGIKDIDEAVMYYFKNVIKPTVVQNNVRYVVPIIYGAPERWKSVQADGYYKDSAGKIQVPLIMFKRDSIDRNRDLGNKLDGNKVSNLVLVQRRFNRRNIYDNFSLLTNRVPQKEYIVAFPPDYITLTYSCIIFTDFVEQMDKLVEMINFASDSYWGDPSKFQFRARIDSYSTQVSLEAGQDRAVKSTFNIVMSGYVIPESLNREIASVNRVFSTSQVIFGLETAESSEQFTANLKKPVRRTQAGIVSSDSTNVTINNITVNNGGSTGDLTYLNTNNTAVSNSATTSVITFTSYTITQPPAGSSLPATTKINFALYRNGQYVGQEYITSITQVGSDIQVTVNTTTLGYNLEVTDTFELIGKLQ